MCNEIVKVSLTIMPESVPLRATLGIEAQDVIVDGPGRLVMHSVRERFPAEARESRAGQRPVSRDADAVLDLPCSLERILWR